MNTPSQTFFPIYSILCLLVSIMTLGLGMLVLTGNPKASTNRTYFAFCSEIAVWLFLTCLNASKFFPIEYSIAFGKGVYVGVALMPTTALHFTVEYLGSYLDKSVRFHVKIAYAITFAFIIAILFSDQFITGYYNYWWGHYPKTGPLHYLHTIFVLCTAVYIILLLRRSVQKHSVVYGKTKKYYELKFIYLSFIFVTLATSDFLHNWGVDFFPIGNIFVALFVLSTAYAIFKHEMLGIAHVIHTGLIYSLLITISTVIYFSCVYLLSTFLGDLVSYHSVPVIVFILALITILLKPIEQWLFRVIDKLFFRRSREVLEIENLMLLNQIRDQERLKSVATLAAGMAHEIKNPLTSIKTFAEYLPKKYDDPEFRDKFSRIVVDEVDRVNNIVRQLLDFAKPVELELKSVIIPVLLEETLGLLNSNMVKKNIALTKDFDAYSIVLADINQLKQAFLNIFLNAIQSIQDKGEISVTARTEPDGQAKISIKDSGCGMSEEQLKHAFDPFYTTKEEGTGLGLAIVHSIITKHGGRIEMSSRPGQGTTVNVFLKSQS